MKLGSSFFSLRINKPLHLEKLSLFLIRDLNILLVSLVVGSNLFQRRRLQSFKFNIYCFFIPLHLFRDHDIEFELFIRSQEIW